ncbi:hypothetical protein DFP72DRAFT_905184 [Ephemerocybe angulata]|uniref:Uncharacterized protein n=1 Tax=Ephemerocybe angulata TaxID=980116 RepID=A0A8H6HS62_9AGAR|nr:hypothetical protein DFP72DRAFT_905184 [Tulosesus angulatus]
MPPPAQTGTRSKDATKTEGRSVETRRSGRLQKAKGPSEPDGSSFISPSRTPSTAGKDMQESLTTKKNGSISKDVVTAEPKAASSRPQLPRLDSNQSRIEGLRSAPAPSVGKKEAEIERLMKKSTLTLRGTGSNRATEESNQGGGSAFSVFRYVTNALKAGVGAVATAASIEDAKEIVYKESLERVIEERNSLHEELKMLRTEAGEREMGRKHVVSFIMKKDDEINGLKNELTGCRAQLSKWENGNRVQKGLVEAGRTQKELVDAVEFEGNTQETLKSEKEVRKQLVLVEGQKSSLERRLRDQEIEMRKAKEAIARLQGKAPDPQVGSDLQKKEAEIERLQGALSASRAQVAEKEQVAMKKEEDLKKAQREIRSAQAYAEQLKRDLEVANEDTKGLREMLERTERRALELEKRTESSGDGEGPVKEEIRRMQIEAAVSKKTAAAAQEALKESERLLATRTQELDIAQAFMTTADKATPVEISRMVEDLNERIALLAFLAADKLIDKETRKWGKRNRERAESVKKRETNLRTWEKDWGVDLIRELIKGCTDDRDPDIVLLERMIQNMLVERCVEVICSFASESQGIQEFLKSLWQRVLRSNETAIAKNWMAITFKELKTNNIDHSLMTTKILELMSIVGWREDAPDASNVATKIQEKVMEIAADALKIKSTIILEVVTADIRPFSIQRNTPYNPELMEDDDDGKATKGRIVVCTLGLGVAYVAKHAKGEKEIVILRSKVLLRAA